MDDTILYIIVSFMTFWPYAFAVFYLWLLKLFVFMLLKAQHGTKLISLESADIYWAVGEKYHNLVNIIMFANGKSGNFDIEKDIKEVLQERLFRYPEKFEKLMCSLHTLLGYPYLIRENIKADNILTVIDIEKTTYKSMQDILFNYSNKPMPMDDTLLWEIIIIKSPKEWKKDNNLKEDQTPLFVRVNHTLGDGLCVMNLVAKVFGENNIDFEASLKNIPRSPEWMQTPAMQSLNKILLFFITPGYMIVETVKGELANMYSDYNPPVTSFKHNIAYRAEASGDKVLESIKRLKNDIGNGTSFSEIILTLISASIYNHFQANYYKIPKAINLAYIVTKDLEPMTVNGVPRLRNQFGLVNVEIPLKMESDSLLERLEVIKKNTKLVINTPHLTIRNFITFNLLEYLPLPIIKRFITLNGNWGCVSNLPEFPKIVLFNGYEVEDSFFYTLQRNQMATGFTLISYDSRVHLGFIADVASVCSKEECTEIVNNIFTNIDLLKLEVQKKQINIP